MDINNPIREFIHAIVWTKRHLSGQLSVKEISFIQNFLEPTDYCIDVGAHAGSWSIALSKIVPRGKVFAIEAFPYYARVLQRTNAILRRNNIRVLNKAVHDSDKPVGIIWNDKEGNKLFGLTHIASNNEEIEDTLYVEGVLLDSLLELSGDRRIRFIKMDIEGAELLALEGANRIIERWRPLFFLEINRKFCERYGYLPAEIFDFFERYLYRSYIQSCPGSIKAVDRASYPGVGDVWFMPEEEDYPD